MYLFIEPTCKEVEKFGCVGVVGQKRVRGGKEVNCAKLSGCLMV